MKTYRWLFALFVVVCYVVIFSLCVEHTRKRDQEFKQILHSAETVIGSYLIGQRISKVIYDSTPLNYDQDRCIVTCRVLSEDEAGINNWTGFDVLVRRENKNWESTIGAVDNHPPVPKEIKKSTQEGR